MASAGAFDSMRVELIEGVIIQMAPIGDTHAAVTHPLAVILEAAFGSGFTARNQAPIALGEDSKPSEPEPDVAIVSGNWRDYLSRKPGPQDIKLIVEIAESTLATDRSIKGALYASAGIPEYWIVNLVDIRLEVYRGPTSSGYALTQIYRSGETVELLLAPGKIVAVADFMP